MSSGMQDVCRFFFIFFFFRSGSYQMLEARGFEDNVTPVWYMCVTLCWHTDVCGHPPPHSPEKSRRSCRQNKNLPQQLFRPWTQTFCSGSKVDGKFVTWKYTWRMWTLWPQWKVVISRNHDTFIEPSKSDECSAPDKINSRKLDHWNPPVYPQTFLWALA